MGMNVFERGHLWQQNTYSNCEATWLVLLYLHHLGAYL
jgi:hypothetical protein